MPRLAWSRAQFRFLNQSRLWRAGVLQFHQGGPREDRRAAPPDRRGHRELQPVQPHAVAVRDDHEPLQDGLQHHQLQPRRNGLLRCAAARPPPGLRARRRRAAAAHGRPVSPWPSPALLRPSRRSHAGPLFPSLAPQPA
jgi:hypothetical protein